MTTSSYFKLFVLALAASNAWAYGIDSSTKACSKPKFGNFMPADKTEAAPGSEFTFIASPTTNPNSIKVSVKNLPVNINIGAKTGNGYKVSGKLPASLSNTYARISINAETTNDCKGNDGWLVKITP